MARNGKGADMLGGATAWQSDTEQRRGEAGQGEAAA
jgi:hypothetical protein